MTKQELVALEIERQSLLATVEQFNRGDQRMNDELNQMCLSLERKAADIQRTIDKEIKQ